MRRLLIFFCALLPLLAGHSTALADDEVGAAIDRLVMPYDTIDAPGISLAVMIDGEIAYERFAGMADLSHDVPIGLDTRFEIASISKQFTAFAIMTLVAEGKISLDQDVRTILPELGERAVPITIRHLLDHSGGLRESSSLHELAGITQWAPISQRRSLDLIFRQEGGNFAAGERQEYSNTGYQLLAEIVTRASGQNFPDFMEERVFAPLGMEQTFVRTDPFAVIHDMAASYRPSGQGFAHDDQLAAIQGSTGIVSTPRDLLKWAHALNTGSVGETSIIAMMAERSLLTNGSPAIGANGQEHRVFHGFDTWSHGGTAGGFRSFLLRIPDRRIAIAVMGNRSDFLKAAFAFDVAAALLSRDIRGTETPAFVPEAGISLQRYVGDYRLFSGIVFSIRRDGDNLTFASFGKEDAIALPQVAPGSFLLNAETGLRLEFHEFAEGRATEMRWQVSEDGFLRAPRVIMEEIPREPVDFGDLSGTYFSHNLQQAVSLYSMDDQLWLRMGDGMEAALELYQTDTFRAEGPVAVRRVKVYRTDDGAVSHILVSAPLADDLEFRRLDDSASHRAETIQ